MPTKKNRITVVVDEELYQEIRKISQENGQSMNHVVRCLVENNLKNLNVTNLSKTEIQEMRETTSRLMSVFGEVDCLVRKMGININQIAKKAHKYGLNNSDIEECMVIAKQSNELIRKLGRWLRNGNYKNKQSS